MKKVEITDEWLYDHMPLADKELLEKAAEEGAEDYQFSRRFERKMNTLIHSKHNLSLTRKYHSIGRKIAMSFLVFVCASSVVVMSVDGFRMKFFNIVETVFETFGLLELTSLIELDEFQNIRPGYVPEGYVETETVKEDRVFRITYHDDAQNYIILQQARIANDINAFDIEYDEKRLIKVNGEEAYLYLKNNSFAYIIWYIGTVQYKIEANVLSEDELIKVASSLVEE